MENCSVPYQASIRYEAIDKSGSMEKTDLLLREGSSAPVQNPKSAEIGQHFRTLSTHTAPFDSAQGAIRAG